MKENIINKTIRKKPLPNCYICGTEGTFYYQHLNDHLFGVPGQ